MDKFSPFHRQLLVAVTALSSGFSVGAAIGYPIVLLQQLPTDPDMTLNLDNTSWIASVHGIAGILSIIMTPIMQWKGRRFAFILCTLIIIAGWTLITFAHDATTIIIGESFHGFGMSSVIVASLVSVSEMIDPKHRSLCMILSGIFQGLGSILVTVIGNFLHYKTVAVAMYVPCILSLILAFMWPDSPSWLAYKGDFERCEKIFIKLRGNSEDSQKELDALISAQKEMIHEKADRGKIQEKKNFLEIIIQKITKRDFFLPMSCLLLIIFTYNASGSLVIFVYGASLVPTMTGITNPLIPVIVLDSALGLSAVLGIIMDRYLNNKQIFLIGGITSTTFLLLLCIVSYLHNAGILQKDSLLFLYCFLGFILTNNAGLAPTMFNVSTELIPVKHRGIGGAIFVICMCGFHTLSIKTAPYLFMFINVWGTFSMYFVISVLGYFLIWKFVPETKHRTLKEIEDYFNFGEFRKDTKVDGGVCVPIMNCV